ncbi:MAG: glycoside hydrolase family 32 protein, partial [Eubacteriales bacterium]|nr:glycoside hydrolase family 32 protein [Eubacteriales bacterium]
MSDLLQKAQATLDAARAAVNPRYRPGFHLSVPAGWMNDPNGFGLGGGRYQLFYQYHPYSTVWGPMHWGHWSSEDLLHWREEPIALAPDEAFDAAGCFSGTSLEQDGKLYLLYTGVREEAGCEKKLQQQCAAESDDCVHFEKWRDNPVIGQELLPAGASPFDFRDPKISRTETGYRAIVASKGAQGGQLLRFDSDDLHHWRYTGV